MEFLDHVNGLLHHVFEELYTRIIGVDFTQFILIRLCTIITAHVKEVQTAEKLLRASRLNPKDKEEYNRLLCAHYGQGKLHPAVSQNSADTSDLEHAWLRKRLKPILPTLMPRKDASNKLLMVILREILVTCILRPLIQSLSDPDFCNQNCDYFAGLALEEHQPSRFSKPIEYNPDEYDPDMQSIEPPTFEEFLKQISNCDTMADAQRIRTMITAEISAKTKSISGCLPDDIINGTKVSKIQIYIDQLQSALTKNDKTIAKLSKKKDDSKQPSFSQILEDPVTLSLFDDFLDQSGHGHLLQYWSYATGFQNQLNIDKSICSFEDEFAIGSWDWTSVKINVQELHKDFFASDAPMNISAFAPADALKRLTAYIEIAKNSNNQSVDITESAIAVKAILIILHTAVNVLQLEDLPQFLKHPLGLKAIAHSQEHSSKHFGRFLKPKSPERDGSRTSADSDRYSNDFDEYDENPFYKKKLSVFDGMFKKRGSRSFLPKLGFFEDKDESPRASTPVLTEKTENAQSELQSILNEEQNTFETPKKSEKLKNAAEDESLLGERTSFLSSFRKKARKPTLLSEAHGPIDSTSSPAEKDSTKLTTTNTEYDAESFLQLEMEDNTPVSIDDNIISSQNQGEKLPPMIILPKRFFDLDAHLENLQKDLLNIEKQEKQMINESDIDMVKNLSYARRGIWHEIEEINLEKQKIEKSEVENIIFPGRVSVKINHSQVVEQGDKGYAVYPIQVTRQNSEGVGSGWVALRRYNQFLALHQDLKLHFPAIMQAYELPGKLLTGLMKKRATFLESRRVSLEKYLQVPSFN